MPPLTIRRYLGLVLVTLTVALVAVLSWAAHRWTREVIEENAIEMTGSIAEERRSAVLQVLETRQARLRRALGELVASCGTGHEARACAEDRLRALVLHEDAEAGAVDLPETDRISVGAPIAAPDGRALSLAPQPSGPPHVVIAVEKAGARAVLASPGAVLQDLFTTGGRIGETGQSFLVGRHGRIVAGSERVRAVVSPDQRFDSPPLRECLAGRDGEMLSRNFQGTPSVNAFRYVAPLGGCVMVQVTQEEAFAPVRRLTEGVLLATPLLMLAAAGVSVLVARRLARPIRSLAACARLVRDGNLSPPITIAARPAELRELCETFATMTAGLRESTQFRERFLGVLAHDLRNPLSAIRMSAQTLMRHRKSEAPVSAAASVIARSAERMSRMVVQLLEFARLRETGSLPLDCSKTDLATVARVVVDELTAAYPERIVMLSVSGSTDGSWDPDRLAQVVSNLVGNALQHGRPAEQPVEVMVEEKPDEVWLTVRNGGTPLPPQDVSTVFDPYRQATSTRNSGVGVGLGLYVVSEIAKAHGGRVDFSSSAEGVTTVVVRLPRLGLV